MTEYMPTICVQYLNVCTMQWEFVVIALAIGYSIGYIISYLVHKKELKKAVNK